jgi:two-component system, chemotaxis family, protein-glutamate methylesterase/glutaminase
MRRRRVLLVDTSVVIRRSLAEALARTPEILVAGSASNGRIALMKIPLLRPDVVVLDSGTIAGRRSRRRSSRVRA